MAQGPRAPRTHTTESRRRSVSNTTTTDNNTTMALPTHFFTVKYGENQEALFNRLCTGQSLLTCLRKKCSCDEDAAIDICDLEGNIVHLPTHLKDHLTNVIDGRRTYVLVRRENEEDRSERYTFLLDDVDTLHPELADKMRQMQSPSAKGHGRKDKGGKVGWAAMRQLSRATSRLSSKSRDGRKGSRS